MIQNTMTIFSSHVFIGTEIVIFHFVEMMQPEMELDEDL